MENYLVVIEKGERNYSACSPDVPGCVAAAVTIEETRSLITEALQFHIEAMVESKEEVPCPRGLIYHIKDGIFDDDDVAEEYYITEVKVPVPQHA